MSYGRLTRNQLDVLKAVWDASIGRDGTPGEVIFAKVNLAKSSVYYALKILEDKGLIHSVWWLPTDKIGHPYKNFHVDVGKCLEIGWLY